MNSYTYNTMVECVLAGKHIRDVDDEGYCLDCGHPLSTAPDYGEDRDWADYHECPKCCKIQKLSYLFDHYEKCK